MEGFGRPQLEPAASGRNTHWACPRQSAGQHARPLLGSRVGALTRVRAGYVGRGCRPGGVVNSACVLAQTIELPQELPISEPSLGGPELGGLLKLRADGLVVGKLARPRHPARTVQELGSLPLPLTSHFVPRFRVKTRRDIKALVVRVSAIGPPTTRPCTRPGKMRCAASHVERIARRPVPHS